jgi:propionyl-CoA carboxylase beta chain
MIPPRAWLRRPEELEAKTEEDRQKFANPFVAASRGFLDDVILPSATRPRIARSLAMLREKKLENPWKRYANIPL